MKGYVLQVLLVTVCSSSHLFQAIAQYEYQVGVGRKSQKHASANCVDQGMEMVSSKTLTEMRLVVEFLNDKGLDEPFWLGLKANNDNKYFWNEQFPVTWTSWGLRESDGNCVVLIGNWYWMALECDTKVSFICQKAATETSPRPSIVTAQDTRQFTLVPGWRPSGPFVLKTRSRSWTDCAKTCLQVGGCDVLYRHESGMCELYGGANVSLTQDGPVITAWRTYIKDITH